MKLIKKISGLIMVLACASATDQNLLKNGDPILAYVRGSPEDAIRRFEPNRSFSDEYQSEVAQKEKTKRAVTNSTLAETLRNNNSSGAYYFDYLIEDAEGNLHFHMQKKYENGTVEGFYGHAERKDRHLLGHDRYIYVTYVADAGGYRAFVGKEDKESFGGLVGLKEKRIDGKLTFSAWLSKSVGASAENLYTSGADSKRKEEDDSY